MSGSPMPSVREAMGKLITVIDAVGDDRIADATSDIVAVMQEMLAIPGLDTVTAQSAWTPAAASGGKPSLGWLYYDCEFRLVRGVMPAGFVQRPHNHGTWNILAVYRGAMHYRSYRRLDAGDRPYVAELEVAEDRILTDGDVTVLPGPPHDIHQTAGLAPETISLLVARQHFLPMREQYLPDLRAYYLVDSETAAQ
jgi:predicted metal-dependent enzyme (double-stranded beta helix superfamily)